MLPSTVQGYYCAAWGSNVTNNEVSKWCHEIFGSPGINQITYNDRWVDSIVFSEVFFKSEADLLLFKLKWGM